MHYLSYMPSIRRTPVGRTIGEIKDLAAEIGKRGVDAVTESAERIPRVVRRVVGKDEAGTETPPEKVIVEGPAASSSLVRMWTDRASRSATRCRMPKDPEASRQEG